MSWINILWLLIAASHSMPARAADPAAESRFAGSDACAACHAKEYSAWQGSQHRAAMQIADEKTVRGNFNAARFSYAGVTSTFFKRDGKFFIRTDGPDGKLHDYKVHYTFGIEPLQQYPIELPGGRFQAMSIAWDVEKKRWFHLYPKEHIGSADELHWTRPSQNWNYMCADCHSTELRKSYDVAADRFSTKWSEISVGCEACHGPGSVHVAWANARRDGKTYADDGSKGLAARLDEWNDLREEPRQELRRRGREDDRVRSGTRLEGSHAVGACSAQNFNYRKEPKCAICSFSSV